jgi:predicted transcriptional regulator
MTNVASTSREAYEAIRADGTLSRQQQIIVDAISVGRNYSLQELCRATGLPINTVSGRCNDLRHLGVLELGPTRACNVSGRQIHPVRLAAVGEAQGALFS